MGPLGVPVESSGDRLQPPVLASRVLEPGPRHGEPRGRGPGFGCENEGGKRGAGAYLATISPFMSGWMSHRKGYVPAFRAGTTWSFLAEVMISPIETFCENPLSP